MDRRPVRTRFCAVANAALSSSPFDGALATELDAHAVAPVDAEPALALDVQGKRPRLSRIRIRYPARCASDPRSARRTALLKSAVASRCPGGEQRGGSVGATRSRWRAAAA